MRNIFIISFPAAWSSEEKKKLREQYFILFSHTDFLAISKVFPVFSAVIHLYPPHRKKMIKEYFLVNALDLFQLVL